MCSTGPNEIKLELQRIKMMGFTSVSVTVVSRVSDMPYSTPTTDFAFLSIQIKPMRLLQDGDKEACKTFHTVEYGISNTREQLAHPHYHAATYCWIRQQ